MRLIASSPSERAVSFVAGPRPAARRADPFAGEIIKIANRSKYLTGAADRFNPAKHNLKMSALIFRTCRPDKGAVNVDNHLVGGFFER